MKAKEMTEIASNLTWDNVAAILRNGAPEGFATEEVAEMLEVEYSKTAALLRAMFDAGACSRVLTTGKTAGTILYFAPIGG